MTPKRWTLLVMVACLAGCRVSQDQADQRLSAACDAKDLQAVQNALAVGADPNATFAPGDPPFTALEIAVAHPEIVEALLKAGASPKKADKRGFLPLGMAAAIGNRASMELLLKSGALLEGKDADGETAVAQAAGAGKVDNVKFLIDCGANVNAKDRRGYTALFQTVLAPMVPALDRTEVARLLIQHGADPNAKDVKGHMPVFYADTRIGKAMGCSQALIDLLTKPVSIP